MFAEPPQPAPPVVQEVVVERVPRSAPDQGLRLGELIVSFRLDRAAPDYQGHPDALVTVNGLGTPRWGHKAPFSKDNGRCLDAHPQRALRSWKPGRQVTVTIRTSDGDGTYKRYTKRVKVVPFNLGESEQSYATTVLDCFSVVE